MTEGYKSSGEGFKCCESPRSSLAQVKYISKGDRTEEVLKDLLAVFIRQHQCVERDKAKVGSQTGAILAYNYIVEKQAPDLSLRVTDKSLFSPRHLTCCTQCASTVFKHSDGK